MFQKCSGLFCVLFLLSFPALAQLDSLQHLGTVYLTDTKLTTFSQGYKVDEIQDSIVKRNAVSLTETLRFNSLIYFKENGFGMVSSPSFRGTNASQTAVIWNGININSNFTGQTDFNVISPVGYDDITIRSGGGGVQYGSGAIGGSVHLNNNFMFDAENKTGLTFNYGSFGTMAMQALTTQTWGNHYLQAGVALIKSNNDYDYVGKNQKNKHGEFIRFNANVNKARKLKNGYAGWNSEYAYSDRNFSGGLTTAAKDGYKDLNTRNLLRVEQQLGAFRTTAKAAHLFEQYQYYPNTEKHHYQQAQAHTLTGQLESEYALNKKMLFHGKIESTMIRGKGENIGDHSRHATSAVVLMKHQLTENFGYGINLRQEFHDAFSNPFLFSADAHWKINSNYGMRFNASKNYRVPTFNDLYWESGGNPNLNPEMSYQAELGQEFIWNAFRFDLTGYYIDSKDMIKWVPVRGSIWQPENIANVRNYGIEAEGSVHWNWSENHFKLRAMYAYTRAEDTDKRKQLIYVPYHNMSGSLTYDYKGFNAYFQTLITGEAYTTSDNKSVVNAYAVCNMGGEYRFSNQSPVTIGGRIKNLFNVYYENVAYRPMPSRSIELFLNLNI